MNNGTPTKTLCSACGKESNTVKKCNGCLCVWYCDKECQNKHRKEHRKECKLVKAILDRRDLLFGKREGKLDVGTEKDLGPLFDLPPREECPICMQVLPLHPSVQTYFQCCGKTLCGGCDYQHQMKNRGRATCAFCRTTLPESGEEKMARLRKRVALKDPDAMCTLAMHYGDGDFGRPVDQRKCIELLRQAACLDDPFAQFQLGVMFHTGAMGLVKDYEKARLHFEKAAEGGHVLARHNLACTEASNDDDVAAMRHWRLSASAGHRSSMETLIECFEEGFLRRKDLAETLQAMYLARAELKSDDRDTFIAYLKRTGEYREEYEC